MCNLHSVSHACSKGRNLLSKQINRMMSLTIRSKLDTEIQILTEKLANINDINHFFDSLGTKEKKLKTLEDRWFSGVFRSGEINELKKDIETTKGIIRTQNLRRIPNEKVKELRDSIRTLEGARDARMA
uniref:Uncharacterized protein LOC111115023 n=1 Tax=Crassostrea virginica TaxID=6565 RepID=A0A8B8C2S9_CRAVI|nr:uncharacterized protein LOC111115023 [Crassostrea virginica]